VEEFFTVVGIFNVTFLLLGIFYAWQIYLAPSPHGWTSISVAVGTLILILNIMVNGFILYHYGSLTPVAFLLIPIAALATAGIPMGLLQGYKKWSEDRENDKLINNSGAVDDPSRASGYE